MKNYEAFLATREKISEIEGRIPGLEEELVLKEQTQANFDEEALRAWALDEPDADKLKARAEENKKGAIRLKEEVSKLKKSVELFKEKSAPAAEEAIRDLQVHYRALAMPLVKELAKRLRAAGEIETQLRDLEDEANQKRLRVTPYPRIVMPVIFRFLLGDEGRFQDGPLGRFLKGLKQDGFDIGEDLK